MEEEPLYCEYHRIYQKFKQASRKYDKILEDKAMVYFSTQPKATNLSKEIVSGGRVSDKISECIAKLEQIDIDLQKARNEQDLQQYLLKKKELELKESKDVMDKLYYLRYIERMKIRNIGIKTNYSKSQIYRYLEDIENNLKK